MATIKKKELPNLAIGQPSEFYLLKTISLVA